MFPFVWVDNTNNKKNEIWCLILTCLKFSLLEKNHLLNIISGGGGVLYPPSLQTLGECGFAHVCMSVHPTFCFCSITEVPLKQVVCNSFTRKVKAKLTLPSFGVRIRPKKNICVFTVTCQKNLGSVGRDKFFLIFYYYYRQNRK